MNDRRKTKAQLLEELNALRQHVVEQAQRSGAPTTDQLTPPRGQNLAALHEREQKLQQLLAIMPVGISILDADRNVVFENPALERILDIDRTSLRQGDYKQRTYLTADGTPMPPDGFASVQAARTGRAVSNVETGIITENGQTLWTNVSAVPVDFSDWKIVVATVDITARKQAEQALRESEARYRLIADNTADVIWVLNPATGHFTYVSPSVEKLRGYTPEEVMAQPISAALTPDSLQRVTDSLAQTLPAFLAQGGPSQSFIHRVDQPCKDGSIVPTEVTTKYVRNERGEVEIVGVSRDITARQRAEEALRQSEERHRLIANLTSDYVYEGVIYPDRTTRTDWISGAFEDITGYTSAEMIGEPDKFTQIVVPEDLAMAFSQTAHLREQRQQSLEYRIRRKDGHIRWLRDRIKYVFGDGADQPVRFIGAVQDVTARKVAETALRESEEKYSILFQQAAIPAVLVQLPENVIEDANEAFENTLGYSRREVIGRNSVHIGLVNPAERDRVFDEFQRGLLTQGDQMQLINKSGDTLTVAIRANQVEIGGHTYAIVTVHDLTQRKRAEEQVQALSRQLIEAQETERRTLARELHDEIGQALTAVKMNLQAMQLATDPVIHDKRWAESVHIVERTLRQTRNLALDLRPSLLDDFGLEPALDWYLKREADRAGIPIEFVVEPRDLRLPAVLETTCYRLVQSAVTNIVRHAQARRARVELRRTHPRQAELIIEDDGVGFDVPHALRHARQGDSLGLVAMQERAQLAGGSLELTSTPAQGTRIRATFQVME